MLERAAVPWIISEATYAVALLVVATAFPCMADTSDATDVKETKVADDEPELLVMNTAETELDVQDEGWSYGDEDEADMEEDEPEPIKKSKKKSKKGTLIVETDGDETAKVFVDGLDVGETTWEDEILPGEYKVQVKTPGLPAWKGKVQIKKGKTTTVTVDLFSRKKGPGTSSVFWAALSATVPTLTTGIVIAALSSKNNKKAADLSQKLDAGLWASYPIIEAEKAQKQRDLVDLSRNERKGAIALLVTSGVLVTVSVISLFIFQKEKSAAKAAIDVAAVAPIIDPETGTIGMGLGGTF